MWRLIPFGLYGHLIRLISSIPIPRKMRPRIWGVLCRKMGIDDTQARLPLCEYPTFQSLFTRELREGSRPIVPVDWVSPVDGEITTCGSLESGTLLQAKSMAYTVSDFVGEQALARQFEDGSYITLYLSPKDYHRIHVPATGHLKRAYRIEGKAYPVRPSYVRKIPKLFCLNDRVVFEMESEKGVPYCVVCVGAAAVRSISSPYLNNSSATQSNTNINSKIRLSKGDHLATFNLGSTVVMLIGKQAGIRCDMLIPALINMGGPLLVETRRKPLHHVTTGRYRLDLIDK